MKLSLLPVEGGWQSVYLYHNLFHGLMSSLPRAGAAAAAAQTEMPTCLWANRKTWAEALANSKKTPCVFFQSWLLVVFYSPPCFVLRHVMACAFFQLKDHWFFMWKNYQVHHLLQIIMNSILFLLPAISALVSELGREAWKHGLFLTLEKQCHALVGCCREVSGLVQKSEICCVDVLTLSNSASLGQGDGHPTPAPSNHFPFHFWPEALGRSPGSIPLLNHIQRRALNLVITSLVQPHCTIGGCLSLAEETWRRSLSTSCGFQSLLWDLQWGWWGKSLPPAQQWLQKKGLLRPFSGKGNPAMRRNHAPQEWDRTCPSFLNRNFSEFHSISSVLNFCSDFGETGIKGHAFRWCIIHWVLSEETFTWEPSAELRAGMEVHNSS